MTDDFDIEREIAAVRERMLQPLSREQIVATEQWLQTDPDIAGRPLSEWTNDDWLRLARHMIKTVEVARDLSAEDIAEALNQPPRHPIPTLDEL
jgi:hypothetical protein